MKYFLLATIIIPAFGTLLFGLGEWHTAYLYSNSRELRRHGKILAAIGGGILWLTVFVLLI